MNRATEKHHTTFQATSHTALRILENLLDGKPREDDPFECLHEIESLFQSLPLATGEFGLAQNRLRNARRYYQAGEGGAAKFELRLLACSLRYLLEDRIPALPSYRLRRPAFES